MVHHRLHSFVGSFREGCCSETWQMGPNYLLWLKMYRFTVEHSSVYITHYICSNCEVFQNQTKIIREARRRERESEGRGSELCCISERCLTQFVSFTTVSEAKIGFKARNMMDGFIRWLHRRRQESKAGLGIEFWIEQAREGGSTASVEKWSELSNIWAAICVVVSFSLRFSLFLCWSNASFSVQQQTSFSLDSGDTALCSNNTRCSLKYEEKQLSNV